MAKKITPQDAAPDEFHGHGGSYVVGTDGKRALAERTKPADPNLKPEPQAAIAAEATPVTVQE